MSHGINFVQLIGRLGRDVTVNNLTDGRRVANLSIATDESYIDKKTGEKVDKTEWHNVVTFQDGLVGMLERHGHKGRLMLVEGRLKHREYQKEGEDKPRRVSEVLIVPGRNVQFLDKPKAANGNAAPKADAQAPAGEPSGRKRRRPRSADAQAPASDPAATSNGTPASAGDAEQIPF